MKKIVGFLFLASVILACNNEGEQAKDPVDSLEQRVDTLKSNVDSSINQKIDSLEERKEELKDKFDSTLEVRKDSLSGKKQ